MKKVLLGVALLGVLCLGTSCDLEGAVCERDCDVVRSDCYDKAWTSIGRNSCDNNYNKCVAGCQ